MSLRLFKDDNGVRPNPHAALLLPPRFF